MHQQFRFLGCKIRRKLFELDGKQTNLLGRNLVHNLSLEANTNESIFDVSVSLMMAAGVMNKDKQLLQTDLSWLLRHVSMLRQIKIVYFNATASMVTTGEQVDKYTGISQ